MSRSGSQGQALPWQHSPTLGFFVYIRSTDEILLRNGDRLPRPPTVPRNAELLLRATLPEPGDFHGSESQPHYTTSPPGASADQDPSISLSNDMNQLQFGSEELGTPRGLRRGPTRTVQHKLGGRTFLDATNPENGIRTLVQQHPPVAESGLFHRGNFAHRVLVGTGGGAERLFPSYKVRPKPKDFFKIGRVFHVLWTEPAGDNTLISGVESGVTIGHLGERVFSKVRRFVVIREGSNYCSALPIMTYGNKGVSKPGVKRSEHAIIYTTKVAPEPLPAEIPPRGEAPMRPLPIFVDPDTPADKLDPLSRLDFGKVHTIQHNIKVKPLGKVNGGSMAALKYQFDNVWRKEPEAGPADPKPRTSSAGSADSHPQMSVWVDKLMKARNVTEDQARAMIVAHQQKSIGELVANRGELKVARSSMRNTGKGKGRAEETNEDDAEDDHPAEAQGADDEGEDGDDNDDDNEAEDNNEDENEDEEDSDDDEEEDEDDDDEDVQSD